MRGHKGLTVIINRDGQICHQGSINFVTIQALANTRLNCSYEKIN